MVRYDPVTLYLRYGCGYGDGPVMIWLRYGCGYGDASRHSTLRYGCLVNILIVAGVNGLDLRAKVFIFCCIRRKLCFCDWRFSLVSSAILQVKRDDEISVNSLTKCQSVLLELLIDERMRAFKMIVFFHVQRRGIVSVIQIVLAIRRSSGQVVAVG